MPILFIILFVGLFASSSLSPVLPGQAGAGLFPEPSPAKAKPRGNYCLTEEQLEEIKNRPIEFYCDRTNLERTEILEEDVLVSRLFIHDQKQLILKEICGGTNYYTWKCHPPSWGSIYANTLWKLRDVDPNRTPLEDGDHFDVYLRKDIDAPDRWICKNGLAGAAKALGLGGLALDSPLKGKIIRVGDKSAFWTRRDEALKIDVEDAPPREKVDEKVFDGTEYEVFINLLKAFSPDEEANFYLVEKGVLPEGNDDLPESLIYDVFAIVKEVAAKGETLKLGTFNPLPPEHGWWDVYLPESKPVVYLYPEKPSLLNVKINPKDGYVTVSDPPYDPEKGWTVLAHPDSTLIPTLGYKLHATSYKYLYYETMVRGYDIPERGWVIKKTEALSFLNKILPQLGLNEKEAKDFTDYWLPRLNDEVLTDYLFVTFLPQAQINEIDPLEFSTTKNVLAQFIARLLPARSTFQPDTLIRVRAYFKPLEVPLTVSPLLLPTLPKREGFTVTEWGGILDTLTPGVK